jgi:hypothetical protein
VARKKFKDTSANRKKRWNKKSPMARTGKQNGSWKGGKSAHYYRRKANAGKNEVVHHVSGGKGGKGKPGVHNARTAKKSNLRKVTLHSIINYTLKRDVKLRQQEKEITKRRKK